METSLFKIRKTNRVKKLNIINLVSLILLVSQISCVINEVEDSKDQIYPIKSGNTWKYERTSYMYDSLYLTDTIYMVVGNRISIDGYTGYSFDNKEIVMGMLFLVDNDKYGNFITYGCYLDTFSRMDQSIRFKLHAKLNDSWFYHGLSWGWYTGTIITSNFIKCLSIDTIISTPNEDFHCMAFREITPDCRNIYSYLSVNIGLVRQETLFDNGRKFVENLIDYKLY